MSRWSSSSRGEDREAERSSARKQGSSRSPWKPTFEVSGPIGCSRSPTPLVFHGDDDNDRSALPAGIVKDISVVPVSISYEKLPEVNFTEEQLVRTCDYDALVIVTTAVIEIT